MRSYVIKGEKIEHLDFKKTKIEADRHYFVIINTLSLI